MYHVGGGARLCPFPVMGNGHGRVTLPKGDQFSDRNQGVIPKSSPHASIFVFPTSKLLVHYIGRIELNCTEGLKGPPPAPSNQFKIVPTPMIRCLGGTGAHTLNPKTRPGFNLITTFLGAVWIHRQGFSFYHFAILSTNRTAL